MVEHRTENSGVGGSIPFIGSIQHFILYYILKKLNSINILAPTLLNIQRNFTLKLNVLSFNTPPTLIKPKNYLRFVTTPLPSHLYNIFNRSRAKPWWFKFLSNFYSTFTKSNNMTTNFWFFLYLQLYFTNFLGYKFNWYFFDFNKTIKTSFFTLWWYKLNSRKLFKNFFAKKKKFYNIILNILFFKKIKKLVWIISQVISLASIRKHKRYFYQVKNILKIIFYTLQQRGRLLGYSLFFKGKLGRKGSVKKSVFFYKYGRVSNSNKSLRLNYNKFLVYTETGVVGCGINLFY